MRNLFKMANRLHKVIFSYINCLEFTFSVIMRTCNCSAKMLPVSSQSVSLDFLPEDQSDRTMSRTAGFTTVILFCFLKSVTSARFKHRISHVPNLIKGPVVQTLDSAIHWISIWETSCTIHWIEIYPLHG